jgi:septal ring factor EnvC (AmiA/AmiB activator)
MSDDLDAVATRRDLRDALANHPTRDELHQALEVWSGALRAEMRQQGTELRQEIAELRHDLSGDIARAANVMIEEMRRTVGFVDDKYRDSPARLDAVEARVDALEPRVEKLETAKRQRRR